MKANVGDWLVMNGVTSGQPTQLGTAAVGQSYGLAFEPETMWSGGVLGRAVSPSVGCRWSLSQSLSALLAMALLRRRWTDRERTE